LGIYHETQVRITAERIATVSRSTSERIIIIILAKDFQLHHNPFLCLHLVPIQRASLQLLQLRRQWPIHITIVVLPHKASSLLYLITWIRPFMQRILLLFPHLSLEISAVLVNFPVTPQITHSQLATTITFRAITYCPLQTKTYSIIFSVIHPQVI